MRYGLDDLTIQKIQQVFEAFPQVDKAILYGSRAKGNFKPGSDIDITLKGAGLSLSVMNRIGLKLDDLLLPYTLDVSVFSHIKNSDLIEHIDRVGVEFYSRWKKIRLREVCSKIGSGATPTGGSSAYKLTGISLIRSQNVLDLKFSYDGLAYIDDVQAALLKNVTVKSNDILLNITGDSVARVCKVPYEVIPARVNQHVAIIRPNKERLNYDFLLYQLQSKKESLLILSEIGGTRNALTKAMLEDFTIEIPPLDEQERIASSLICLDNKIDLLHRQNKTLEQLAETLFRQWFVEEAEEDSIGKLGQYVKTTSGGTPSRSKMEYYLNGSIKWVKSKELVGSFIFDTEEKITEEALKNSSAKLLPQNSILVAMYGATVGEYALLAESASCNQAICALLPNNNYPYTFLFNFIKYNKENLIGKAVGSAQQNISQELIKDFEIIKPNKKILAYHLKTESMYQKIKSNISQIQSLTKMRDTLLPKLMSGEIRVKMPE